ncbi:Sec-independent protein translocase TatA [Subtercola sp. Z020]|nr:twin-arginine translocase TatA/TatE family subunit [Subtercola sp. Z020]PPF79345.1 Sec-independent protein translocase TatA [Subtercola sp. Z020]
MLQNLTGWHAVILLAVVLLFFGASKLPNLARSVGQSARIFKSEVASTTDQASEPAAEAVTPAQPAVTPPVPATSRAETS